MAFLEGCGEVRRNVDAGNKKNTKAQADAHSVITKSSASVESLFTYCVTITHIYNRSANANTTPSLPNNLQRVHLCCHVL